ncbi:MAG TPA: CoB--CoM heterodisulfide reductase iron-sulfur subunit B family protein [Verrucomicrobiae bacterium]|nr:CoB--CoM heterodisulfide reductase iron-sulfur subunit B family protein [Verrucomicrobiae bacterium]
MTEYAYFPGCLLNTRAREYTRSSVLVCKQLGIELTEVPDWNCCGSSAPNSAPRAINLALSARNLTLAAEMDLDIFAPCPSCYRRLSAAKESLNADRDLLAKISTIIDDEVIASSRVLSIFDILTAEHSLEVFRSRAQKSLNGIKIAAFYGCFPATYQEQTSLSAAMNRLVKVLGGELLPWPLAWRCCGGHAQLLNQQVGAALNEELLHLARESGAECMVTICPSCHFNLDLWQHDRQKSKATIPILYLSQLAGLVFGFTPKELGLTRHLVNPLPALEKVGLI